MKPNHKLRKIWHDAFYKSATKERFEFALKCQDVTAGIDLHEKPQTLSGSFRFWLHLSLCQACRNYYDLSKVLSKAVKNRKPPVQLDIEHINKSLLEKYGQKKN